VECPYFTTAIQEVSGSEKIAHESDSFTVLIGVKGSATLQFEGETFSFGSGETVLVPAAIPEFDIESADGCTFLKTWVPA
jgi:mannose-6-phosphate isomerase